MKGIDLTLKLGLSGAVAAGLLSCAGSGEKAPEAAPPNDAQEARAASQPWERDPCTRTSEILIDGAVVGYLIEYQALPVGRVVERALPTGSYRIQGPRFEELGFVTARGEVRRYVAGGSESLGIWPIEEGLRRFFDRTSRVTLRALTPAPARKAAAPAEGEGSKEGGEKGEGEAGGEKKDAPGGK